MRQINKWLVPTLSALWLAGCGGGGSDTSLAPSPTPPPAPAPAPTPSPTSSANQIVSMDTNVNTGQAVDLFLLASGNISDIQWRQTSGPSANFLARQSKAIAFTASDAGSYSFEVSYRQDGNARTATHTIDVVAGDVAINGRLGHAVVEGNKVSLRAGLADNNQQANIRWRQVQGPGVSFTDNNTDGDFAVFFNAPQVNQDTLLVFEVSLANGNASDTVSVLVEDAPAIVNNAYFDEPVAKVVPYNANSPHANNLAACVYSNQLNNACQLSRLPLIAQETLTPSVDDIMNRVLVSHQWMGDRFREFLTNEDPNNDFKNLLRATTAVVISYDVRPSFYWAATGAIYLDPNDFWLTPDERDTINEAPDFRANFSNDLQFSMPFRYVLNNDFASRFVSRTSRVSRVANDRLYSLASLMYHELAHANDFFPSSRWSQLNRNDSVLTAAQPNNTQSNLLESRLPLFNQEMRGLAQVSFAGETANATQRAYQPADIVTFYTTDRANEYYSYSTIREDFAVLFEELMMQSRYQAMRDTTITNRPQGDNVSALDFIITWGQRGRVADPAVQPRVQFVADRVLPELDTRGLINNLATPRLLDAGDNWIESLIIGPNPNVASKPEANEALRPVTELRYYHRELPNQ
ncbi:hypothetical protein J7384_10650 [Endozoicomonas sp. G2_1]|uniref:hypothetical protein n=1 Tax=Endozoicomonas sp. G2_1 TaxID=2821091 RepID=UPI001ADA8E18|nr:hypothetical protein [Endozoicomonas sp. G2_1]MBO9490816.1 hypothetical protein [Endozoicomonas sp. G2_1]